MELVTREVQTNQMGKTLLNQFLLDEDYNVSDSKRDMKRIIASEGRVRIEDVKIVENYIRVSGKLEFQVLYEGDGLEPVLCSLEGKIPFEEMMYTEDKEGMFDVKHHRVELSATMIHSRKLRLRAMIELEIVSEKTTIEEIPTEVEGKMTVYKK